MADTAQIGKKQAAGLACQKESDPEACRFLEDFDAKGIDLDHPFLQGVKFQDPGSLKAFRERLDRAAGAGTSDVVLRAYTDAYLQRFQLTWKSVDYQLAFGKSLMAISAQGDQLWTTGKILEVQAMDFLESQRSTCSAYLEHCDKRYEIYEMQGLALHHFGKVEKLGRRFKQGGGAYVVKAIEREARKEIGNKVDEVRRLVWENLGLGPPGETAIDAIFSTGKIEAKPLPGNLPGYELHRLTLAGDIDIGLFIIGDPQKGARVRLIVDEERGIRRTTLEEQHRGQIQFQGPVAMDDEHILAGTAFDEGIPLRILTEPGKLDGLVMVDHEGFLKIDDKRDHALHDRGRLEKLIETAAAEKLSIVSAASFDPTGKREKWREGNHDDQVRLLFTFQDGKFGILNGNGRSANQLLAVLYRLQSQYGKLTRVVLCDRGLYDTAAYYEDGVKRVALGSQDRPTRNAIVFLSEATPSREKEAASARADAKTNP